jgi:cytidyltransferase-like protein
MQKAPAMPLEGRVGTIEELAEFAASLRAANKKVVHCHGVFDLLHVGVIRHLEQARKLGDALIVTVVPDEYASKGRSPPFFRQEQRAEALAALGPVDYVAINKWPQAVEAIRLLRPSVYVPGDEDWETEDERVHLHDLEDSAIQAVGGRLALVEQIAPRSPALIHHYVSAYPSEMAHFLASFSARCSAQQILDYLQGVRSLKVLLIGETIIDEYQYCETMGKSGKEPILAVRYVSSEKFAGGVLSTANQAAELLDHAGVLTFLGTQDSHEEFIRERLNPRIDAMFLYLPCAPTTIKRRFVELYPFQKLFEVYVMHDEISAAHCQATYARLKAILPFYDAVVVTDYGHGMLTPEIIDLLCRQEKFLAVNTQANAANQGFNTISRYQRADYICLSEREVRLEARSRTQDLRTIVSAIAEKLSCRRMLVTQGQEGCLCYQKGEGFFPVPPFTRRIVDRVGAGDALFAVTALCAARDVPMEAIGFIGNAVGAMAVETVGNRSVVARPALYRQIESLMHYQHY